jgi:hypothetical protein
MPDELSDVVGTQAAREPGTRWKPANVVLRVPEVSNRQGESSWGRWSHRGGGLQMGLGGLRVSVGLCPGVACASPSIKAQRGLWTFIIFADKHYESRSVVHTT